LATSDVAGVPGDAQAIELQFRPICVSAGAQRFTILRDQIGLQGFISAEFIE
jgi:hypothetical protein